MRLDQTSSYSRLRTQAERMRHTHIKELFRHEGDRDKRFSLQAAQIYVDFSKHLIDDAVMQELLTLANEQELSRAIHDLFEGAPLNNTEQRPALHTALRQSTGRPIYVGGVDVIPEIRATQQRMRQLVERIHSGQHKGFSGRQIDTLVSIGIGGSYLGPKAALEALTPFAKPGLRCHFVANIDGSDVTEVLRQINPETTLFLLQTKSFSTLETLENARVARAWMYQQGMPEEALAQHFYAVTANVAAAEAFGITADNCLPMWDWVGGRYSLWSAIGLPIAFMLGYEHFEALLQGAEAMDQHFREAPFAQNIPVVLALLGLWYNNFFDAQSHAVLPYDHYLANFTAHLQQLDMESNGKGVDRDGLTLSYQSGPIIWGGVGSNGQHAYHQLLHQGTRLIPADFIIALRSTNPVSNHHAYLVANCLSQTQALMLGKTEAEATAELLAKGMSAEEAVALAPHKVIPGNKPSTTLVVEILNPSTLGALIALYEHKVFVQGILWHLDSFDQWGVELGKVLGEQIFKHLLDDSALDEFDCSTRELIARFRKGKLD